MICNSLMCVEYGEPYVGSLEKVDGKGHHRIFCFKCIGVSQKNSKKNKKKNKNLNTWTAFYNALSSETYFILVWLFLSKIFIKQTFLFSRRCLDVISYNLLLFFLLLLLRLFLKGKYQQFLNFHLWYISEDNVLRSGTL